MSRSASWSPELGTSYVALGVLDGVYRGGRARLNRLQTHLVAMRGGAWRGETTVCGRIDLEHMADMGECSAEEAAAPPSCPSCRRRYDVLVQERGIVCVQNEVQAQYELVFAGYTENAALRLWRFKEPSGLWAPERTVTPETAESWKEIFERDEPEAIFVVANRKPTYAEGLRLAKQRHARRHQSNGSSYYYVWVVPPGSDSPLSEGPYGPYPSEQARTYARISATEGKNDRVVTRGLDPGVSSFRVVRRYAAGTGESVEL